MNSNSAYFDVIGKGASLLQGALNINEPAGNRINALHQIVMRGESEIPIALREALAAFVSRLNMCPLCYKAHAKVAELLGFNSRSLELATISVEQSPLTLEEKALFNYAKVLTSAPSVTSEQYFTDAIQAGWSERSLNDAINVICLFNLINRFVLGHGIRISDQAIEKSAHFIAEIGYWDIDNDSFPVLR